MSEAENPVNTLIEAGKENHLQDDQQICSETKFVREKEKNNSSEKSFCCHICGVLFSRKYNMTHHIRVHDGYRYICRIEMCYRFFTSKEGLQEHKLIHSGERPLVCKVCSKTFRQKSVLAQHLKIHSGEKPYVYVCKECQNTFAKQSHLKMHMRSHTGEKTYSCKECPKTFSSHSSLQDHMRTHTGETYACNVCQRLLTTTTNLKRHLRIHIKEKPFSCAHCSYKASRKYVFKIHLRKCFEKHGFEDQFTSTI